ncbi:class I SAM-dependent methyltransferase [Pectobacterium versatile]|uniref:class I SAM-dependent methyltransferase n=1 Tax=Pectobacterium versatile TaxID=2488639 RepID=UPI00102EC1BA|nr:SAM-dependent methyltransferase [Pectobacterium versatile]TAI99826.1 SAM-dependent methyltransferase [Pectobacterium versatile]UEQ10479.1 class I SAM-dependent methyltransferase [Pectobacterium versatile]
MSVPIIDMCCGSRMFWFDKQDDRAVFLDARSESHTLCDGRTLTISPDIVGDFRHLPFPDESFKMAIFDPPHLRRAGLRGWMRKKYGCLDKENWQADIAAGFREAFRVLAPGGTLIFKWNATQIPVSQVIALTDRKPVIWQRTGKKDKTHWIVFMKEDTKPEVI